MSDTRYLTMFQGIPTKLPDGHVLVHNHVTPQKEIGWQGFRAWTQRPDDKLELCTCDWAGVDLKGHKHYRMKMET